MVSLDDALDHRLQAGTPGGVRGVLGVILEMGWWRIPGCPGSPRIRGIAGCLGSRRVPGALGIRMLPGWWGDPGAYRRGVR